MTDRVKYPRAATCAIAEAVCREYGVTRAELFGESKRSYITAPRHEAWRLAEEAGVCITTIGRVFGRDHSTVFAGINSARRKMGLPPREVVTRTKPIVNTTVAMVAALENAVTRRAWQ